MTRRACSVGSRVGLLFMIGGVLSLAVGVASAWEVPAGWTEIGTVRQWQALDARFYRSQDNALYLDESFFNLNQPEEYARTFRLRGALPGVRLDAWRELPAEEQNARRKAAGSQLKFLTDFRNRVSQQAQDLRQTGSSGWGAVVGDRTITGDVLTRLYTAVNVDPSNPYAWHLYSYFATLVGDEDRALAALGGAEQALAAIPPAELTQLRADVALDRAWLERDLGHFDAARAALEVVAANGGKGQEARLLQGLIAAQTGDVQTAITIASELRHATVGRFPVNLRSRDFAPDTGDVNSWDQRRSSYLADWILAFTWLREGRLDMVRSVFGGYSLDAQRPFAFRFWREAGQFYEVTGRGRMARQAWLQGRVALPYYPFTVYKVYSASLERLTGRPGKLPYLLGFDRHFLTGSRLAYAADLVAAVVAADEPGEKDKLAARAMDQLEICERFGIYPGQAAVLQGQIYYQMNDLASARLAIEEGLAALDARGDVVSFNAVLSGLNRARAELDPQDIANFYGQSGVSRGRWQGDDDPVAKVTELRAAFAAEPNQENRRNLARALIRQGETVEGRDLATAPLQGAALTADSIGALATADLELVLEADRAAGDATVALLMVDLLRSGRAEPWQDASVWTLAGFICLDQGLADEGRSALERAVALDPGNHGLQVQLSLM